MLNTNENIANQKPANHFTTDFKMQNTHILIVDHNDISNHQLSLIFDRFHVKSDVAKSGKEAVRLYQEHPYDIVFMDSLSASDMDGVEAVNGIRGLSQHGKNQLIVGMISDHPGAVDFRTRIKAFQVELFLLKPVNYFQIAVILRNELRDKIL